MRIFTHTIWIAASPDAVFDYFIDFDKAPRWRSFVTDMHVVGATAVGTGSVVSVAMEVAGEPYTFTMTVLACERPRLWRHRTDQAHYEGAIEYTFTPEREGTRVIMSMRVRPRGLYGWFGLPLLFLQSGKSYAGQLPSFKRAVESRT